MSVQYTPLLAMEYAAFRARVEAWRAVVERRWQDDAVWYAQGLLWSLRQQWGTK